MVKDDIAKSSNTERRGGVKGKTSNIKQGFNRCCTLNLSLVCTMSAEINLSAPAK